MRVWEAPAAPGAPGAATAVTPCQPPVVSNPLGSDSVGSRMGESHKQESVPCDWVSRSFAVPQFPISKAGAVISTF